jgi:endonuclease III
MKPETVDKIFARLKRANPEPRGELAHINPYTLLVAVVLSAQATDVGVNRATKDLFPVADTPEKMVALGEAGLKRHIKTIGLFNTKAKNVIALSRILAEQYQGEVPPNREILESLPGVGRKTANVVLGHALGVPGLPVDRHVLRVANRLGIAASDDPETVERQLCEALPRTRWTRTSDTLILHGRRICRPKPLCDRCNARELCRYYAALSTVPAARARKRPARAAKKGPASGGRAAIPGGRKKVPK